jgi:hypothetical protein
MSHGHLWRAFKNMMTRCYNPKCETWKYYGGRGISVCEEWRTDKTKFFAWALSSGVREDLEIDRVDNNGNYEPENCRWVTHTVNMQNSRRVRHQTG